MKGGDVLISLLRVDGRLIHGMITVPWCGALKPDCLIVVNDKAANDPVHTMTLKLAKPANVDVFIWTHEKAYDRLNGPKFKNRKCFITCATIADAEKLVNNVSDITKLNIGPEVDEKGGRITEGKENFHNVYISKDGYEILKRIHNKGVEIFAQVTPMVERVDFTEIANRFEK